MEKERKGGEEGEKRARKQIRNKAVYTAALVADGWAGAEDLKKVTLLRTDGPTDRRTDRKVDYRVACPRLKIISDDGFHSILTRAIKKSERETGKKKKFD